MSKIVVVIELEDDEYTKNEIIKNFKKYEPSEMLLKGVVISMHQDLESYMEDKND